MQNGSECYIIVIQHHWIITTDALSINFIINYCIILLLELH